MRSREGIDSIQFGAQEGMTPIGMRGSQWDAGDVGVTEMVLVNMDGKNVCGTDDASQTEFRSGWKASRQCDCENVELPDECGGFERWPIPSDPPVCEKARIRFWAKCDPSTCPKTTCKLPTPVPPAPAPPAPAPISSATCAANAGCVALGLTGDNNCCPTEDGMQLACCDQIRVVESAQANPELLVV